MADADRIAELIQRHLDEGLSDADRDELEQRLREDPAAADAFAAAARLHASLGELLCQDRAIRETSELVSRIAAEEASDSAATYNQAWSSARWASIAAAVFISLGLGLLAWQLFMHRNVMPLAAGHVVVSGEVQADASPDALSPGQAIRVTDGPAVIRLADGSEAELATDCRAVLRGSVPGMRQYIELLDGQGTFRVEPAETQFQVETRLGRVTALGTEFSVKLSHESSGESERGDDSMKRRNLLLGVAVISGLVQVEFAGSTYLLSGGENRVFAQEGEQRQREPRERLASIAAIDTDSITLTTFGDRPQEVTFGLTPKVKIVIDGKPAAAGQLAPGMLVYYSQLIEAELYRLRAEGPTIAGRVAEVDTDKGRITLRGQRQQPDKTYPLAGEVTVTINGSAGKLADVNPGAGVAIRLSADKQAVVAITQGRRREARRDGDRPREGARDGDRPREVDRPRDGDRPREGARDGDRPRDGDQPREGARDGDRPREGARDGDRPREGARDRDRPREGARDGDRPREVDRPRDGDRPREGARDGDRPREGRRDGEQARQWQGTIKAVDVVNRRLTISGNPTERAPAGKDIAWLIPADARITYNGQPKSLGDLSTGLMVKLTLSADGKTVTAVAAGVPETRPRRDVDRR